MMLWQDIRYALRQLRHSPGFAAAAILSLALGIGANTAIFTLLDQVLLRPLPVPHPEQLVHLNWKGEHYGINITRDPLSYPAYRDFRERNQVFSGVVCRFPVPLSVAHSGQTELLDGELVSGNYFDVLGVGAVIGRVFNPQDDRLPGGHPLAVLSYAYWNSRFHRDPSVVGQSITVNGLPLNIIGVGQNSFDGVELGYSPRIWIPIAMKSQMTQGWFADFFNLENRRAFWLEVFARLRPGITQSQAQASLQPLFHSMLESELHSKGFENASASVRTEFLRSSIQILPAYQGGTSLRDDYETPLQILMGIVVVVLIIACANVANLLLERAVGRQREVAVRLALGAKLGDIVRQTLTESVLLALLGGAAGLFLAVWTDAALVSFLSIGETPLGLATNPDVRILGFTLAVCLATGLLFGIAPLLSVRRVEVASSLKENARSVAGTHGWFRRALVVAQVGLSAVLLIGAGQLLRTLVNLRSLDLGLQINNVVEFSVNPSLNGYGKEKSRQLYHTLLERLRETPGVQSSAASALILLGDDWWGSDVTLDSGTKPADALAPNFNLVSPAYFSTLGIALLAGRDFSAADALSKQKVAVVNQLFAKQYFTGRNPVGHRIGMGAEPGTKTDIEIIGVMKDAKYNNVRSPMGPQVFLDDDQNDDIQNINVYVKTTGDPRRMYAVLRRTVQQVDPNIPVFGVRTLAEQAAISIVRERLVASLAAAFALLATVLAAVGVYALIAYSVTRRTREIGIRMALGAGTQNLVWLVMREVLALVAAGACIALPVAWSLSRFVASQLYGVSPHDTISIIGATVLLSAVAALAGYWPARRALAINPIAALRSE
jgi:predicted permease